MFYNTVFYGLVTKFCIHNDCKHNLFDSLESELQFKPKNPLLLISQFTTNVGYIRILQNMISISQVSSQYLTIVTISIQVWSTVQEIQNQCLQSRGKTWRALENADTCCKLILTMYFVRLIVVFTKVNCKIKNLAAAYMAKRKKYCFSTNLYEKNYYLQRCMFIDCVVLAHSVILHW